MTAVNAQHPCSRTCVLPHWPGQVCLGKQPGNLWIVWLTIFHCSFTTATLLIASQFVAHLPCVDAADLQACGARLQERQDAAWNATNHTESPPQFSLPYEQCLVECGSGMEDVNWESFSQNFGAWLLPWIALMFQIPFGAERKFYRFTFAS